MVKRDSYVILNGFMKVDMDLKGNELFAYAIIYGFSQDGESAFTGGNSYLCDWLGCSKPTVINVLKSLIEKGYIRKIERTVNHVTFNSYQAILPSETEESEDENIDDECGCMDEESDIDIEEKFDENLLLEEVCPEVKKTLPGVKKFNQGGKEILLGGKKTLPGVVKKFNRGGKEILPNKINKNNINNNIYIRGREKTSPPALEDIKKYAAQINAVTDPETFFEYYQSREWKVNGCLIDWRVMFKRWNREDLKKTGIRSGTTKDRKNMEMQRDETSEQLSNLEQMILSRHG